MGIVERLMGNSGNDQTPASDQGFARGGLVPAVSHVTNEGGFRSETAPIALNSTGFATGGPVKPPSESEGDVVPVVCPPLNGTT